jgi:protein phosphatase
MLVEGLHAALLPLAPLGQRVAAAQAAIGEVASRLSAMAGTSRSPGSTISVLLLGESHAVCLWVGDSRIYLCRDGALLQLTRDHSLAQEMVDRGLIASAELAGPAQRSRLTRAVGGGGRLAVDRLVLPVQPGDRLLLCTDGISMVVPDTQIVAALDSAPAQAAQGLVELAAALGSADDVTALVVAIDAAG